MSLRSLEVSGSGSAENEDNCGSQSPRRPLVNLFSGLAVCQGCGSRMTFRGKGVRQRADGSAVSEDYLVCDSYQRGRGCGNGHHFNYAVWEEGILDA